MQIRLLDTFFSSERVGSLFQGAFLDSVEKAESCPIIGGPFEAFYGFIPKIFAAGMAKRLFQLDYQALPIVGFTER